MRNKNLRVHMAENQKKDYKNLAENLKKGLQLAIHDK